MKLSDTHKGMLAHSISVIGVCCHSLTMPAILPGAGTPAMLRCGIEGFKTSLRDAKDDADLRAPLLQILQSFIDTLGENWPARSTSPELLDEAKKLLAFMDELPAEPGGQQDRVFAGFEFDGLRAAVAVADPRTTSKGSVE